MMNRSEISVLSPEQATDVYEPTVLFAVQALRTARQARQDVAMHTNTLAEYEEMLPTSRWNLARKRRLSKWLKQQNYYTKEQARDDLNRKIDLAQKSEESSTATLKQEIGYFREFNLGRYEEPEKAMVEELFGKYGVPPSVTDGYDEAAKKFDIRYVVDWLAHSPSEDEPYGATDDQVAHLLEWNINKTEELAQDQEGVVRMTKRFFERIDQRVAEKKLHPSWSTTVANVERVVIGDMLNRLFVGFKNNTRGGEYNPKKSAMVVWPYETTFGAPIEPIYSHEMIHSMTDVDPSWLCEGLTEKYNRILTGELQEGVYEPNIEIINILQTSGFEQVSDYDLSGSYIGHNKEQNLQSMKDLFANAYKGCDVLGGLINVYDAIAPRGLHSSNPRHKDALGFTLHVARLFKESMPFMKTNNMDISLLGQHFMGLANHAPDDFKIAYSTFAKVFSK